MVQNLMKMIKSKKMVNFLIDYKLQFELLVDKHLKKIPLHKKSETK